MMKIVKTACVMCHMGCGLDVYVDTDRNRIVRVRGMKEHPLNEGFMCAKAAVIPDFVHHPDRLRRPLKRVGEKLVEVSWREALNLIRDRLLEIRRGYGPESVAGIFGFPILLGSLPLVTFIRRFYDVFGTPNVVSPESMCYRNQIIAHLVTLGKFCIPDIRRSNCIVVWGKNLHASQPVWAKWLEERLRDGARLIVIDPRRTRAAEKADIHLRPRPGTDAALALALINVIIEEGLYDRDFVDRWTVGFEKLAERAAEYRPGRVEEITGVPSKLIVEAARMYATTKPACIVQGTNALDQTSSGFHTARAIAILQAITGNVDVPGGFVRISRPRLAPVRKPELLKKLPLGVERYPLFYEVMGRLFGEGHPQPLLDAIIEGDPYPVKAAIINASNPVITWPNTNKVRRALEKLEFLVVMDLFMTETAEYADLVLPACTFLERTEVVEYYALWGVPYVMARKQAIKPLFDSWSDMRFFMELARIMGYGEHFPWKDELEYYDYVLKPSGISMKTLLEDHPEGIKFGDYMYREYEARGFKTPSGKIELYSSVLERSGYDPLPRYIEPSEGPMARPDLFKRYPLVLFTGLRQLPFTHSQLRNVERLRSLEPEPTVEIHPETAEKYGVRDGQLVYIESPRGRVKMRAKVSDKVIPEAVGVPHGWPGEACQNILTKDDAESDVVGYPTLKSLLCRIYPAD